MSNVNNLLISCRRLKNDIDRLLHECYMQGRIDLAQLQGYRGQLGIYNRIFEELGKRISLPFIGKKYNEHLTVTAELLIEIAECIQRGDFEGISRQFETAGRMI